MSTLIITPPTQSAGSGVTSKDVTPREPARDPSPQVVDSVVVPLIPDASALVPEAGSNQNEASVDMRDVPFFWTNGAIDFGNAGDVLRFHQDVRALNPVLVVIDTLSRCIPGQDENSQAAMSNYVKTCDLLRQQELRIPAHRERSFRPMLNTDSGHHERRFRP